MKKALFLVFLYLSVLHCEGGSRLSLSDIFYTFVQDDIYPCFRLTNATHQIGCSGSATSTNGVLYYLNDTTAFAALRRSAPHAPYITLLEPIMFTSANVLELKEMSAVKGIIVRHVPNLMASGSIPQHFSPEKKCPNELSGSLEGCNQVWNPYIINSEMDFSFPGYLQKMGLECGQQIMGTNLIFTDFGDFPIFAITSSSFDDLVKCYSIYTKGDTGSNADYPLCAVELTADMAVVRDTPTCYRRQSLPVPYLNSQTFCDPLGDFSVWGSAFNLSSSSTDQATLLTAKLDSISFFPGVLSLGASSEVAAIATLMGVIEQLGNAKRSGDVMGTQKRILYAFLHGESWDYIGSSRMAYDMKNENFPHKLDLPRIGLNNISGILELGELGIIMDNTVYVHGAASENSSLIKNLEQYIASEGLQLKSSSVIDLPPASLQRFLREGVKEVNPGFTGSVLSGFNTQFINRYFGSRFDNIHNLGNGTLSDVACRLANLSTAIAKAVLNDSVPECVSSSCADAMNAMAPNPTLIEEILSCFLVDASCDLFRGLFTNHTASLLFPNGTKVSRYVTVNFLNNTETVIVRQMMAYLSANNASQQTEPIKCSDCLERILRGDDKTLNVTWMQYTGVEVDGEDLCLCLESFTYSHSATSPAFDVSSIGYDTHEYSTWAESSWNDIQIRVYLVTYTLKEVGFLFLGLFVSAITFLVSCVCTCKGSQIFDDGV